MQNVSQKQNFVNGNLSHIAFGISAGRKWSLGFALLPVSNVGYKINSQKIIEGTRVPYQLMVEGSGGLTQLSFINSIELLPFLSVGLSVGYTFGTLDVNNEILFDQDEMIISTERRETYHGWNTEFGIQLSRTFGNGTVITLGGIYRPHYYLVGTSYYQVLTLSDSLIQERPVNSLLVPYSVGAGFSLMFNKKIMWALDYTMTGWSTTSENYMDNMVISSGVEWLPDRDSHQNYMKQISYRLGASYESGYLILKGCPIRTYIGTVGVGLPIRNFKNRINLTLEIGRQGTTRNSLIVENYYRFILNVNLQDIWFRKYKYD
jgi:hypothetical protein